MIKQDRKIEEMMRQIEDRRDRLEARRHFESVATLLQDKLRIERAIDRLRRKLIDISNEVDGISGAVLGTTIRNNMIRIRHLFEKNLEAIKGSSGFFYNYDENFISIREVYDVFRHIIEFIQTIFDNKYVTAMGAPKILIIPGNGNTLYDYRENLFVVPLTPVSDLETSITAGISQYIRHYNYSRSLIHEFNQLFNDGAIHKEENEIERFNTHLAKWLFSEYRGFKVFDKPIREYFTTYFSPQKGLIYCPIELLPGVKTPQQENLFIKDIKVDVNLGDPSPENIWYISIIEYRRGRLKKCRNYLKKLIRTTSEYIFAYYNLGIVCQELRETKEAEQYMTQFIEKSEPSWWTIQAKHFLNSKNETT
ncbi:tetratricopeptide repeat protein [Chitinivibrio alkaliphilus]|uniref:Uncharacterized protein n=1 Tax=Chitinivibrio alkaliphilus ACht1 TaxID=1313304 RepID=U7D8B2_9BACT|nr:hypothetical protein [Chitinivibrio alkaliphilus]ERP31317.1 hypothetical protein CALK_1806 [Chitinivibrio alkaliphilus ACht1]